LKTIQERIKYIRQYFHLNQIDFSKKIKVGKSTVSCWEIGTRPIKPIHIEIICNTFNIQKEWLEKGIGKIFKEDINENNNLLLLELKKQYGLTDLQTEAMQAFLSMTSEQKDIMLEAMQIMSNMYKSKNIKSNKIDDELSREEIHKLIDLELDDVEKGKTLSVSTSTNSLEKEDYKNKRA
jgi:transcriptional regulator with XRE-family HTH domain